MEGKKAEKGTVLVVGAGYMGAGIAQACAQSGYRVRLTDISKEALEKALRGIEWSLGKLSSKGTLKEPAASVLERLEVVEGLGSASLADWVIEAVLEVEELKKEIFSELDKLAPPDIPLATNTSSIPISRIAEAVRFPNRLLGLHFFGPVPLMGLVEVIKGEKTSDEMLKRGVEFVRSLGKRPVRVQKDIPCFVMNRIFSAAFREALDLVSRGVATVEDVDAGMRLGYGWRAGPFEIADNAGLDTYLLIGRSMKALGEEALAPSGELIERMVSEGRIGRKAGRGFYMYDNQGKRLGPADDQGVDEPLGP